MNSARSFSRTWASMKVLNGGDAEIEGRLLVDLLVEQRLDAGVVGLLEGRRHHEGGEEHRQTDQHHVGRRGLRADRRTQDRQHDHDPVKEVTITRMPGAMLRMVISAMS